jgi:hypothetical protein
MSDLNLAIEYCLIQSNILMSNSSSILMHYYICLFYKIHYFSLVNYVYAIVNYKIYYFSLLHHLSLFLKKIMQLLGSITIAYSKILSLVHMEVELI